MIKKSKLKIFLGFIAKTFRFPDYIKKIIAVCIVRVMDAFKIRHDYKKTNEIWLFGGFGGRKYDDNSAALYEYVLKNCPNIDAYWVINKRSCAEQKSKIKGKVLIRKSIKANIFALIADVHVCSHGRHDISEFDYKILARNFKVFLGHGVDGLKKIDTNSKNNINKDFDLFCAVSEYEKSIKAQSWGVDDDKIIITGLPRYDNFVILKEKIKNFNHKRQILYMPTWRDWLVISKNEKDIKEFTDNISEVINNEELIEYLCKNDVILNLYIHIEMTRFINFDKNQRPNINYLDLNINLQEKIVESDFLITDYSSISWDFLYLNKPTIFYQFDYDKYMEHRGSYINMKKDLFGLVCYSARECIDLIKVLVENNASKNIDLTTYRNTYFKYKDNKNCERLYESIVKRCKY